MDIQRRFELAAEDLDEVHEQMESGEIHEDAWGLLCPEQEVERLESREEFREMLQAVGSEQEQEDIPDLAKAVSLETANEITHSKSGNLGCVRGSFHQGDFRFEYAGVQCMVIALVALAKHSVCNVFSWDQRQLDLVLNLGDALYTDRRNRGLTHGRDLLIASDLPRESVIDGQQFSFSFSQPVNGAANVVEHEFIEAGSWVTLDGGLEQMLAQYDTCLMTLCGAACAVIKDNGRYAVVDSHSRSAEGLVDPDGKSVVMYFSHIDELMQKYKLNLQHKQNVKAASKHKYKVNPLHKQKVKAFSKQKYRSNEQFKNKTRAAFRNNQKHLKQKRENFTFVLDQFLKEDQDGPEYICCVCLKLLFRNQVLPCRKDDFMVKPKCADVANACISEAYLHACDSDCPAPCPLSDCRGSLWICYTCNTKLCKGQMPSECSVNNLQLDDIPPELACLNTVEQHIVALNINFMQVLALPKGGQRGIHGPVTCVPSRVSESVKLLPRSNMDGCLLPVKLKRKLTYKGHYEYQYVDTERVRRAIAFLKQNNRYYLDIDFNEGWVNEFVREEEEANVEDVTGTGMDVNVEETVMEKGANVNVDREKKAEQEHAEDLDDELLHDRQRHCMYQDTFFMPVDIAQEALDHYFEGILNLAPAEGNSPVSLLSDKENEAKCFPKEFPLGHNTFHCPRPVPLTMCRYFINRLLHVDGRFAQNFKFLFLALYMLEVQQVVSKVSIALRKGHSGQTNAAAGEGTLENLLQYDNGYRFMQPIRGTPPFWQSAQKDLFACIRQLGIPTWFCSFSSADLRWPSLLKTLLKQEGSTRSVEDLDWAERCDLLRRHPVTAARMFDSRWRRFLRKVILSPAQPIGKVIDYFYRVEFQQRGSPHVHCLFWIENAPKLGVNTDEEVVQFVDKYVTCELPSDPDLLEKVTSVQQHSKRHSKTCKKKNKVCRFNFPRPVSARTFIKQKDPDQEPLVTKEEAEFIMSVLKNAIVDENNLCLSAEELFASLGLSQFTFEQVYNVLDGHTHIVLKRDVAEAWINNYNEKLLTCWNANMDIQYVVDAWACVVYIISYISKAERDMGLLLTNAQKEASKGNVSAKEAFKKLGSVYLHNRDVSAQEAVYRVTNMHLKEFSRKVTFVPTGDNIVRMSKPIGEIDDEMGEDIWMTNTIDRYLSRPNDSTFNDMCIATFVSEYRLLGPSDKCKNPIILQNGLGAITKRTRTKPAVVRYARFSETKNTELFHQSILQLFMPYRVDTDLKPPPFETFEHFYKTGDVCLSDGSVQLVKSIVDSNRRRFELAAEDLDEVHEQMDCGEIHEDAWGLLCPEQEVERLESREEFREMLQAVGSEQEQEAIPDLAVRNEQVCHIEKRNVMSRQEGLLLVKTLNEQQLSIFYKIRQWCLDKVAGNNPEPLHIFITAGAGTGKSHLITTIQYEASRLFAPICHSPDNVSVLLTAPTGIAAYNLQAATIHTTFSIGTNVSLPYTPLGEEKINTLRVKYMDLQIVIIDETSMVDKKLFTYIHGRLRQIKQSGDFSPFGNVSVITVGDFYQLSPVMGQALYKENIGVNLFTDLFKIAELTIVVRQKDNTFAELLNRLKVRSRLTPLLDGDIDILKHCETGEDPDVLHIFTKNSFVSNYNLKILNRVCPEKVTISARDFGYDKKTGKLIEIQGHLHKSKQASLEESLILGVNARVMLCKNVDLSDGLVNGVCGIVTHIVQNPQTKQPPLAIYVKFDDDRVGAQRRRQTRTPAHLTGSTRIEPEEEQANKRGEKRRQFPLKLAWACTVHKVQGVTVDQAVVSLKQVFTAGQAYVALSRVRSLEGLVIQDFDEDAIYCNDGIRAALQNMPPFIVESMPWHLQEAHVLTFFYMNVHGLERHVSDLALCTQPWQPNCIAVVETWLTVNSTFQTSHIEGFNFHSRPRSLSYQQSNHPALTSLLDQRHGGVGIYCEENLNYEITVRDFSLECLVNYFAEYKIIVSVIYRPPSYPMSLFKYNLDRLLNWLESHCATVVVTGDFNDDILKSSNLCNFMIEKGYVQYVTSPTTERGTLIDHLYVKSTEYDIDSVVVPTYFSDHEGIVFSFKGRSS
ncbi:LOW QUALITY PROTEIN: uncharacterized protein LOC117394129 [Periophthalmus magnuspinnatus]|uniref:LOW QUALITY PROTEIN: uncharacterized protein LOC117394129 n=1 Tax=Periophthalmus magnuspinnatus TaxID=409849 RepID=UPI0024365D48|nr:LOW QUALITY PROTEIN: uncharacterized protein LOC117394129 [Periophthalmus magnuspinnatus]